MGILLDEQVGRRPQMTNGIDAIIHDYFRRLRERRAADEPAPVAPASPKPAPVVVPWSPPVRPKRRAPPPKPFYTLVKHKPPGPPPFEIRASETPPPFLSVRERRLWEKLRGR